MRGTIISIGTFARKKSKMACINSDGSLTKTAKKVMAVIKSPLRDFEIAEKIHFPVYLVRSSLRELVEIGLIEDTDGKFSLTELGLTQLNS